MKNKIDTEKTSQYIKSLYLDKGLDEDLLEMRSYAEKNYVPIIERESQEFLKSLLLLKKPERILEIGTAIGYSAIFFAKYSSAQITSIERDPKMYKLAIENIKAHGLEDRIEVLYGDALDLLKDLQGSYDFIFIDAAKGQYKKFFDLCLDKMEDGALVVSDNILYKGMIADDDLVVKRKKTIVKRIRQYLDYLVGKKGFQTSIVAVGDGLAVTIKEEV